MEEALNGLHDRIKGLWESIGGELTADNMAQLTSDELTLLAWDMLHTEVMDGGFVQLIHNGYGPFMFKNPVAKAFKLWGLNDLSKLVYAAHTLYVKYGAEIERDCTDEEFMALFERYPEFDDLDDAFVEHEEEWEARIDERLKMKDERLKIKEEGLNEQGTTAASQEEPYSDKEQESLV